MNVIDTLTAGFSAANKRLWIIAIPIVVDLFLWLGPKLVAGPSLAGLVETNLPPQYVGYGSGVQQLVAGFNLFSVLVLYVPSLIVRMDSIGPLASSAPVAPVDSLGLFMLAGVAIGLAGLFLGCIYLGFVAQLVRDGKTNIQQLAAAVLRYWSRVVLFLLLVAGALAVSAIPLGIAYLILASISPTAGEFLALLVQIAIIWMVVYLYFAVQAVLLNDVGPIQAMRFSVMVISRNFWASITFMGITFLVTVGLPIVWEFIAANPAGLLLGIVGNAYIGTGLAVAGFLFYRDRLARVQQALVAKPAKETE